MKKLNNKGFTLVELLAVIVILAIIAGVAYPLIGNALDNSREKAWKSNCKAMKHAAEEKYMEGQLGGDAFNGCTLSRKTNGAIDTDTCSSKLGVNAADYTSITASFSDGTLSFSATPRAGNSFGVASDGSVTCD